MRAGRLLQAAFQQCFRQGVLKDRFFYGFPVFTGFWSGWMIVWFLVRGFWGGGLFAGIDGFFHGKGYPVSIHIDIAHGHADLLLDFYDVGRVFHEAVRHLTDMNQTVLMDTDIHKCAKGRYVRHDTGKLHAFSQVTDFIDAIGK